MICQRCGGPTEINLLTERPRRYCKACWPIHLREYKRARSARPEVRLKERERALTPVVRPHAGSVERQDLYLAALRRGASITDAAGEAGIRVDSVPHWRARYPEFARREAEIHERAEVVREISLTRQCVCGRTFKAKRLGQEFCSKRCATREVKTSYWGPKDTLVLDTLREKPSTRRALVITSGIPIASLRSILNRLHRRGYIGRIGATRGLYAVWTAT